MGSPALRSERTPCTSEAHLPWSDSYCGTAPKIATKKPSLAPEITGEFHGQPPGHSPWILGKTAKAGSNASREWTDLRRQPGAPRSRREGRFASGRFPEKDVFNFNDGVFAALKQEWDAKQSTPAKLWEQLRRYE